MPCQNETENFFEGGNLKIGSTTIDCSSMTEFTYVIFNINLSHELQPILKGTRYVFKSNLNVINKNVSVNQFPFTKPIFRNFKIGSVNISDTQKNDVDYNDDEITQMMHVTTENDVQKHELNPYEQWASDFDDGYQKSLPYRKGLYLHNKIAVRTGQPVKFD